MTKKKPFTEEQEERIKDIAEGKAYAQNQNHVRWSLAHDYRWWLLFMALAVFIGLLSYHAYLDKTIDPEQLKAEIYQDLGYEKVCIKYSKSEIGCLVDMVSGENTYSMSCYSPFDHDYCIECIKEYSNLTGFKIINSEFWVRDNSECTKWQWQPRRRHTYAWLRPVPYPGP